jgi:hypothetical protein
MLFVVMISTIVYAGKNHGEPCVSNLDCQTNVCKDGLCDGCPDPINNCPPPGVCAQDTWKTLDGEVSYRCKQQGPFNCKDVATDNDEPADCTELARRLEIAQNCVKARQTIMQACFKDGNDGHRDEFAGVSTAFLQCGAILNFKKSKGLCK